MKKNTGKREVEPGVKAPAEEAPPPSWTPHPLQLNPNEGRWLNLCEGPYKGWFCFGEHGNPPFDTPVQIAVGDSRDEKAPMFSVVGIRTNVIDEAVGKERWNLVSQFKIPLNYGAIYWRPLSLPPR